MNKSIIGLFLIASVIAISNASKLESELLEPGHGSTDLEDSFGSLKHHSGDRGEVGALTTAGEDELTREKRKSKSSSSKSSSSKSRSSSSRSSSSRSRSSSSRSRSSSSGSRSSGSRSRSSSSISRSRSRGSSRSNSISSSSRSRSRSRSGGINRSFSSSSRSRSLFSRNRGRSNFGSGSRGYGGYGAYGNRSRYPFRNNRGFGGYSGFGSSSFSNSRRTTRRPIIRSRGYNNNYNQCFGRYGWFRGQWCGNGNRQNFG